MRAHAAGKALGAGMFADMVVDEIIGELTGGSREVEMGWRCGEDEDDIQSQKSLDSSAADAQAKTRNTICSGHNDVLPPSAS